MLKTLQEHFVTFHGKIGTMQFLPQVVPIFPCNVTFCVASGPASIRLQTSRVSRLVYCLLLSIRLSKGIKASLQTVYYCCLLMTTLVVTAFPLMQIFQMIYLCLSVCSHQYPTFFRFSFPALLSIQLFLPLTLLETNP